MATSTPVYALDLPVPGGDEDTWGNYLNDNWSKLEAWFTNTFDNPDNDALTGYLGTIKSAMLPAIITGPRTVQGGGPPGWVIDRAAATNAVVEFKLTGGSGFAGQATTNVFGIGGSSDLSTRKFSVNTSTGDISWTGAASGVGSGITGLNASSLASGTVADARLPSTQTGKAFTTAISFGSSAAPAANDLSRHINLYGGAYGFNVTGARLNAVFPASAAITFVADTTDVGQVALNGFTGKFRASGSTVGAPAYTSDSDSNTGLHFPAANQIDFVTGGVSQFRVSAGHLTALGGGGFFGDGGGLTGMSASQLTTGTVSSSRLPTDSGEVTRFGNVLADVGAGAVGSDRMLLGPGASTAAGDTDSGSSLRNPSFIINTTTNNIAMSFSSGPAGTWRAMQFGSASAGERPFILYRRIS